MVLLGVVSGKLGLVTKRSCWLVCNFPALARSMNSSRGRKRMLLKITESCSMGCKHCMNDARPSDKHMTKETLETFCKFVKQFEFSVPVVVSGGEPTEHPDFEGVIRELVVETRQPIIVTTNGVWMQSHEKEVRALQELAKDTGLSFQVTVDPRYYPVAIDTSLPVFQLPEVLVDSVPQLYPMGRALVNGLKCKANAKKCLNFTLICRQVNSFKEAVLVMEQSGRLCCPAVRLDGTISLGEADQCQSIGTLQSSLETLYRNALWHECHKCDRAVEKLGGITSLEMNSFGG